MSMMVMIRSYLFGPPPEVVAAPDWLPILLLNFLTALPRVILFFTCLDIELPPDCVVSLSSGGFCKPLYYTTLYYCVLKGKNEKKPCLYQIQQNFLGYYHLGGTFLKLVAIKYGNICIYLSIQASLDKQPHSKI